jgi:NAD(P)-dependent dehydrogenase (short-subunit alcohol dehydrogenase family)
MATPKGTTADGFETQFGTNHLGHFVFVNRIAKLLKSGSRLVTLSSAGHRYSNVDLADPNFEHTPYTSRGSPTAAPRPPTFSSPSSSIAATRRTVSAPPPSTRAASRPSSAAT